MTRILAVSPGADWSTSDVYNGIVPQLKKQGVEIVEYNLSKRIVIANGYLKYLWRKTDKSGEKPNDADAVYMAGSGILERALRFDVDWVYVASGMFVALDWLRLLKKAGLKVALHCSESPYDDERQVKWAEFADIVWTNDRGSAEKYGWHYLPHAYDPSKHYPSMIDPSLPQHDVVFVGSGFEERIDTLMMVDWDGIDFGLYGNWEGLGSRHRLRKYLRGGVTDNAKAARLYSNAKIGLNLHRTSKGWGRDTEKIKGADSLNPRAYELAACGVFQISDYRREVDEIFDGTIPTFTNVAQMENHIRHYLANPDERESLRQLQHEAIQSHTFEVRAKQIINDLTFFKCESVRRGPDGNYYIRPETMKPIGLQKIKQFIESEGTPTTGVISGTWDR